MTWWAFKKDKIVNKTAVATFWVAFGNTFFGPTTGHTAQE